MLGKRMNLRIYTHLQHVYCVVIKAVCIHPFMQHNRYNSFYVCGNRSPIDVSKQILLSMLVKVFLYVGAPVKMYISEGADLSEIS